MHHPSPMTTFLVKPLATILLNPFTLMYKCLASSLYQIYQFQPVHSPLLIHLRIELSFCLFLELTSSQALLLLSHRLTLLSHHQTFQLLSLLSHLDSPIFSTLYTTGMGNDWSESCSSGSECRVNGTGWWELMKQRWNGDNEWMYGTNGYKGRISNCICQVSSVIKGTNWGQETSEDRLSMFQVWW